MINFGFGQFWGFSALETNLKKKINLTIILLY